MNRFPMSAMITAVYIGSTVLVLADATTWRPVDRRFPAAEKSRTEYVPVTRYPAPTPGPAPAGDVDLAVDSDRLDALTRGIAASPSPMPTIRPPMLAPGTALDEDEHEEEGLLGLIDSTDEPFREDDPLASWGWLARDVKGVTDARGAARALSTSGDDLDRWGLETRHRRDDLRDDLSLELRGDRSADNGLRGSLLAPSRREDTRTQPRMLPGSSARDARTTGLRNEPWRALSP